jgi:hypothetical protein
MFLLKVRPLSGQHIFCNQFILAKNVQIVHTFFEKSLINYGIGLKIQFISGNKAKINPIPHPFHGQTMAAAMKMTVEAAPYIVFGKKLQNFRTFIAFVLGRIVQKDDFWHISCCFQGGFQPDQFPFEDLLIMLTTALLFKEPAPGATNGVAFVLK